MRRAAALALVAALPALASPRTASAAPGSALVMPFDASAGSVSFLVAHHAARAALPGGVRTHWAFWDEACTPRADAIACLPPDGSAVVDPTRLGDGASGDLAGARGFAVVTAYDAAGGCDPDDRGRGVLAPDALTGTFTLAALDDGVSFGGDAIALAVSPDGSFVALPGRAAAADVVQAALRLSTFDPADLDVSRVILLALRDRAGAGAFRPVEVGPATAGDERVRSAVAFADRRGAVVALGEASLGCATFTSLRRESTPTLVAPGGAGDAIVSGGVLLLEGPRIGDRPLGGATWLFGFHAQAVGAFGALASGAAETASGSLPSPSPTPGAGTPTPRPTATTTTTPAATRTPARTATPLATPGTPTPSPVATGVQPTGSPTPAPTPTGGATATPLPSHLPATPTATPTPGATATPTPSSPVTPTGTPVAATPTPTPAAPGCITLRIEVRTSYVASPPGDVSGVIATVSYPTSVAIPGSGTAASVAERVGNARGVGGLFQATDSDTQVRAGLISVSAAIPAGPFARILFDCTGGPAPGAAAFACALEASTLEGDLVPGATCTTEIVP